jgi:hypothetical protein
MLPCKRGCPLKTIFYQTQRYSLAKLVFLAAVLKNFGKQISKKQFISFVSAWIFFEIIKNQDISVVQLQISP